MFAKRVLEVIPEESTPIWSCVSDHCSGWMRDNFAFEIEPLCPLCHSTMVNNVKMLPSLHNNNSKKSG